MQQMSGKLGRESWILSNIRSPREPVWLARAQSRAIAEPRCWGELCTSIFAT